SAASPDGVWTGTYDCSQGLTGVRLTITGANGGALVATVDFYPVATNPSVAEGSYELVGTYSAADGLVLHPDYWVDEPPGYEMVGLSSPRPAPPSRAAVVAAGWLGIAATRLRWTPWTPGRTPISGSTHGPRGTSTRSSRATPTQSISPPPP